MKSFILGVKKKVLLLTPSIRMSNHILARCDQLEQMIKNLDYKNEYTFWLAQQISGETPLETRKRVFAQMPKATGQLREIQEANNLILKRIKRICDDNQIPFFLFAGTLLGAVRHRGYIPWDDDIDIGMLCSDYVRFQKAMEAEPELEVKRYYSFPNVYSVIKVKLKNCDSFFVDIFLYDYVDADFENADASLRQFAEANARFREGLRAILEQYSKKNGVPTGLFASGELDRQFRLLKDNVYRSYSLLGKGSFLSESIENDPIGRFDLVPVEKCYPLEKNALEFEGERYSSWRDIDRYLSPKYGDYWSLPRALTPHHTAETMSNLRENLEYMKQSNLR